jgi:hypothetical protein
MHMSCADVNTNNNGRNVYYKRVPLTYITPHRY